jgi:FKBP-type peptidyl-prolyl cis-trans isomerase (trigger factor)
MSNNQSYLSKIIMEEYKRAQKAVMEEKVLTEGTQNNPIRLDPNSLQKMILEESRNLNVNLNQEPVFINENKLKLTSNMLRNIIIEEKRKLQK